MFIKTKKNPKNKKIKKCRKVNLDYLGFHNERLQDKDNINLLYQGFDFGDNKRLKKAKNDSQSRKSSKNSNKKFENFNTKKIKKKKKKRRASLCLIKKSDKNQNKNEINFVKRDHNKTKKSKSKKIKKKSKNKSMTFLIEKIDKLDNKPSNISSNPKNTPPQKNPYNLFEPKNIPSTSSNLMNSEILKIKNFHKLKNPFSQIYSSYNQESNLNYDQTNLLYSKQDLNINPTPIESKKNNFHFSKNFIKKKFKYSRQDLETKLINTVQDIEYRKDRRRKLARSLQSSIHNSSQKKFEKNCSNLLIKDLNLGKFNRKTSLNSLKLGSGHPNEFMKVTPNRKNYDQYHLPPQYSTLKTRKFNRDNSSKFRSTLQSNVSKIPQVVY